MARISLAILLAVGAASAHAQPSSVTAPLQPSVDSAEERQVLRKLSACLAESRPQWARRTLSHPYLSEAQAHAAAEALIDNDNCVAQGEVEVTFRTSTLVGSLAEHFLRARIASVDFPRLQMALATIRPLNVTEDFALCVASRDPPAARDLTLSEPGSDSEKQAGSRVASNVKACTAPGEQLTVDLQALRALMATALYRGLTTAAVTER